MRVTDPQAIKALAHPMRLDLLELLATEHEVSHVADRRATDPGTDAAHAVAAHRGVHRFDDILIYNEPRRRNMLRPLARGMAHKAFRR